MATECSYRPWCGIRTSANDYRCFKSRSACQNDLKTKLTEAYNEADGYFDVRSSRCLALDATKVCAGWVGRILEPWFLKRLEAYCSEAGKSEIFAELKTVVDGAEAYFANACRKELSDNREYYKMYEFTYFIEQCEVEKNAYYCDMGGPFFNLLEKVISNISKESIDYQYHGAFAAIGEMEDDAKSRGASFGTAVQTIFRSYMREVEIWMERIAVIAPAMTEEETAGITELAWQ